MNKLMQSFFTVMSSTKEASDGRALMLVKSLKGFFTTIASYSGNFVIVGKKG